MRKIEIRPFNKSDLNHARKFALIGMHFSEYTSNGLELYLYSKYVILSEFSKSTLALGAYLNNRLVGFIFAKINFQVTNHISDFENLFINVGHKLVNKFDTENTAQKYDQANKQMLEKLFDRTSVPAEINFFAVDPTITGQGIGSQLLAAVEDYLSQKSIYLYTDSNCNYQFYLAKGFQIFAQKKIALNDDSLTCFLLYKQF